VVFGFFVKEDFDLSILFLEEIKRRMGPFCIQLNLIPEVLVELVIGASQIQEIFLIKITAEKLLYKRFIENHVVDFGLFPPLGVKG
jgi:hypothetical protein